MKTAKVFGQLRRLMRSVPTEKGKTMTALEYMEKKLQKNSQNYVRELERGAPQEVLDNILTKMLYYAEACQALQKGGAKDA